MQMPHPLTIVYGYNLPLEFSFALLADLQRKGAEYMEGVKGMRVLVLASEMAGDRFTPYRVEPGWVQDRLTEMQGAGADSRDTVTASSGWHEMAQEEPSAPDR